MVLKLKEKKVEEFNFEIEKFSVVFVKVREVLQKVQIQEFQGFEDYEIVLLGKEVFLVVLCL